MCETFSRPVLSAQLPRLIVKTLSGESKGRVFWPFKPAFSDGHSGTRHRLRCGKFAGQSGTHCSIPAGRFPRWARQSARLRRHARCPPASCALARANVLGWNVFIITKLIRGCGMTYTPHLAWQDEGEMRVRDAALTPTSQAYLVTQGRTHRRAVRRCLHGFSH